MATSRSNATCKRVLQFASGPNQMEFAACEEHRGDLERGDVSCFFADPRDPMVEVSEDDDEECWFCRTP